MGKELTENDRNMVADMLARARAAMAEIEDWDQDRLNRLSQAIAWYAGNEKTFTRLAQQGVDESGIGDREGRPAKRFKIHMVLRDVLRAPSTGIVEVDATLDVGAAAHVDDPSARRRFQQGGDDRFALCTNYQRASITKDLGV